MTLGATLSVSLVLLPKYSVEAWFAFRIDFSSKPAFSGPSKRVSLSAFSSTQGISSVAWQRTPEFRPPVDWFHKAKLTRVVLDHSLFQRRKQLHRHCRGHDIPILARHSLPRTFECKIYSRVEIHTTDMDLEK